METRQAVIEFLLSGEASIEQVAEHVDKDIRTVYRVLKELKSDPRFRVMRWGAHGAYVYRIERVASEGR